jgi:hypothetical protein
MNRSEFQKLINSELPRLFQAAREHDELAFLFAVLGVNSEKDDAGWQPIGEAQAVVHDVLTLINGPLLQHAKVRLALMLYCHIIETGFPYHCLYNLLLTVEGRERRRPSAFSTNTRAEFRRAFRIGSPLSRQRRSSTNFSGSMPYSIKSSARTFATCSFIRITFCSGTSSASDIATSTHPFAWPK